MINILTALAPEARPLIDNFRLKKRRDINGFAIYYNAEMTLIVSGIGKQSATAATGYLQGLQHTAQSSHLTTAWLNIGIAGSAQHPIGQDILAHKILDQTNAATYYPTLCFELPCPSATVTTVEQPITDYQLMQDTLGHDDMVFDMEAAAFFATAARFSTAEIIHCYKVISDNPENPTHTVTPAIASELIHARIETINQMIEIIKSLQRELSVTGLHHPEHNMIINLFRFSVTQQHQLHRLLQRWQALTDKSVLESIDTAKGQSAKRILEQIESQLNLLPVTL